VRRVAVERHPLGPDQAPLRPTGEDGWDTLVEEPSLFFEGGRLAICFTNEVAETDDLLGALRGIRYSNNYRTAGLTYDARTFGFLPRVTLRKDFCTECTVAKDHPRESEILCRWAERAGDFFRENNPEEHARQAALLVREVRPEWVLPGGVFTSGIANYNNPLRYHCDRGNFRGSWSAMYALTHDVRGGYLVLPAFRLAFRFHRPSLILFDGQANLHGVSPLRPVGLSGYRYSVVYYAMQGMRNCLSLDEELTRIRRVKTGREVKRARVGSG
jgi:hypothetical protein